MRKIFIALALIISGSAQGFWFEQACFSCTPFSRGKWFITGDVLYWRAFENGLDTCLPMNVSEKVATNGKVTSKFHGESRDPSFKWNPGVRLTLGYRIPCSWDGDVTWTHFHSRSRSNKSRSHFSWTIDLDVVDPVVGYGFCIKRDFILRPFGGLRIVKIEQKIRHDLSTSKSSFSSIDNNERLIGVGPLFGVGADWGLGYDFSLYANASLSWVYGRFRVHLLELDSSTDTLEFCSVHKHLDASVGAADAGLGIRWRGCLWRTTKLILQFGLEHHRYFDYNRLCGYGDLSFDGVNFSAGLNF